MADPTFEAFLWSLTQQESGGNYGAVGVWVNGDRAYGRYQVMGANIPSWTAQYYGRRLTPQQYLASKEAQDAVVRGRLGEYVKKYGYRGAASAWYSGQANLHMSTRPQPGGPSIKGYVDSVMNRAATYQGGSGMSSTTTATPSGSGGTQAVTPKLDRNELAEQYGLSAGLINSSKELSRLFEQAVSGGWSPQLFAAKLKNSQWWKTQPDSLRKYITTKHTDPATWRQQSEAAAARINRLAVEVGLGNQMVGGKPTRTLQQAVYNAVAMDWTDQRIKDWLGTQVGLHGDIMWGEAGEVFDQLHGVAYANGLRYSSSWYRDQAKAVVSGRSTASTVEDQIRRQAAARYGAYREQIMAGQNVMDLASPYLKTVATLLELPETDVDLFNKHVSKAMTSQGTKPLWEFEVDVRSDPLWKKTNNARESMFSVAHQVLNNFGVTY
ncbi:hypothetical protein [Streptomyces sp. NPDC058664]|uniref:hypothetical protein n=1 Tax=unclassified Streptomyces TaxID=2593676 RepID=UPI003666F91F